MKTTALLLASLLLPASLSFAAGLHVDVGISRGNPAAAPAPNAPAPQSPDRSPIVANTPNGPAVAQKDGTPLDGLKLSQHDFDIRCPNILVTPDNTIHVLFIEQHKTTYKYAVYYTASTNGGASFSTPKNLSEPMPNINVGTCYLAADAQNRVYAVWRTGLRETFGVSEDPHNINSANLVFRVLSNNAWNAKPLPVHPPGSTETQDNGSLSCFVTTAPDGHVHVVYNAIPDRFHPELMHGTSYKQHDNGIGAGLVFDSVLDGSAVPTPKEIHMAALTDVPNSPGYKIGDGYDTLNGYFDNDGLHFLAQVLKTTTSSSDGHDFNLYEGPGGKKVSTPLHMPGEIFLTWRSYPTLLRDAQNRQHILYQWPFGEQPCFKDQLVGADTEPTIIRQAAKIKGTADAFQAFQAKNGRMIICMQMNDTGEHGDAETYVSLSDGTAWSTPVNVTNNHGRTSFAHTPIGRRSSVSSLHRTYPGPAAATLDNTGHLLLALISKESTSFGGESYGLTTFSGESTTPTLRFLKF
jgi:hypothetical protein